LGCACIGGKLTTERAKLAHMVGHLPSRDESRFIPIHTVLFLLSRNRPVY
jgi:hypothetical protein